MKVLGIVAQFHDSSACLYDNGSLTYASAEERWSRITHVGGAPVLAVEKALSWSGIDASEVDSIAVGWQSVRDYLQHEFGLRLKAGWQGLSFGENSGVIRGIGGHVYEALSYLKSQGGTKPIRRMCPQASVHFVDHHRAHALSAAIPSGFKEAAVLVIDGRGTYEATSLWHYRHKKLSLVEMIPWPNSLGLFYAKFTAYLGFKPLSDEWKVMGLAAWGNDGIDLSDFIRVTEDAYQVNAKALNYAHLIDVRGIENVFGPKAESGSEPTDFQKDLAFAVQRDCERAMLAMARRVIAKTKCQSLCMAGGVHLNCKANGRIISELPVREVFIQPAAGDDGACLGAALDVQMKMQPDLEFPPQRDSYVGPRISDEEIEEALHRYKLPVVKMKHPAEMVAHLLTEGNIIGFFQGRMEFGPRALGCRSIIADPRDPDMTRRVNEGVKFREAWRPFAPAILEERYHDFFILPLFSPYMILSGMVKEDKKHLIPAVVHVDGSARPQSVSREVNPYYWDVIKAFEEKTGVPVILNTSFNLKGEPIVSSPYDALRTFITSGLDVLVMEDYVIRKQLLHELR